MASRRFTTHSLPRPQWAWLILAIAILGMAACGVFARFYDLGGAPLADDEYYTARSIEWILTGGLPAIPSGGYYVRGPLFQYAAAGFAELFGTDAFAYRLPSAICGLLVGVLGFLYARRFGGVAVGLAVAAALLLSSWAIEFGRLVRFYTLFQVTVLLFLLALDRAYFEARVGWRYVPQAVLLLAALAHEMAVLLAPLLFLPLLPNGTHLRLRGPRRWLGFALVSLLVTFVVYELTLGLDLRTLGVTDGLPEDYHRVERFGGPFATPALPFFQLFPAPIVHVAAIGLIAAALVVAFVVLQRRNARHLELPDLLLVLALLAAVFHQFAAMGLVLAFAFARYDLWRLAAQPAKRLILLGITLVVVLGWLALATADPERLIDDQVVARWGITDPTTPGAALRALWSTFLGWPDFYRSTLRPFASELPELGLALLAALVWFVVTRRHDAWPDLLRHPGTIVLYWAVIMALFTVGTTTSRYWFPMLPVMYTLLAVSLAEAATRWRPRAEFAARRGASVAFLLLFALGPDFQPRHIVNVADDAVRYRTEAFARFEESWYPRRDVRTAAETVQRWHAAEPETRIVIEALPALSYYLDAEHAVYHDRGGGRFPNVSRERGRLDLWSGQRLLSTPEELLAYATPAEELWLVRSTDTAERRADLAALRDGRLTEVAREVLGQDSRIELIRLRPAASLEQHVPGRSMRAGRRKHPHGTRAEAAPGHVRRDPVRARGAR